MIIVPLLALVFHVDIRYAVGASLVSVIATSSGAAAAYVGEGLSNIRIGMFLEVATTLGAISGALLASRIPAGDIAVIFGCMLIYSAYSSGRAKADGPPPAEPELLSRWLKLGGVCRTAEGRTDYVAHHASRGFAVSYLAGIASGLLGIGGGAVKVLAMDRVMRIPFKVATATSNFMIGVTAAASAGIYLSRGYIAPGLVMPVMLGVLTGSVIGSRVMPGTGTGMLRVLFTVALLVLAAEMIFKGLTGGL